MINLHSSIASSVPLFSFGVDALETVNRKQSCLSVLVVYVSVSVGCCSSSATATTQHHQHQQQEHQLSRSRMMEVNKMLAMKMPQESLTMEKLAVL